MRRILQQILIEYLKFEGPDTTKLKDNFKILSKFIAQLIPSPKFINVKL